MPESSVAVGGVQLTTAVVAPKSAVTDCSPGQSLITGFSLSTNSVKNNLIKNDAISRNCFYILRLLSSQNEYKREIIVNVLHEKNSRE